jgi:hypothetical protein
MATQTFLGGVLHTLRVGPPFHTRGPQAAAPGAAAAAAASLGSASRGRVCHYVTILIQTRLMTAVIVCIFERIWIRIVA